MFAVSPFALFAGMQRAARHLRLASCHQTRKLLLYMTLACPVLKLPSDLEWHL